METDELKELVNHILSVKSEGPTLEIKAAEIGCPKIYDTFSSFSNQSQGGIIVFGIDEKSDFEICGVYDAKLLQEELNNRGKEMFPVVEPYYTLANFEDKVVVSAEISPVSYSDRPCYYKPASINKGSYKRVGDADRRMEPSEIYDYYVFRHSIHSDRELIEDPRLYLNQKLLDRFIESSMENKKNLSSIADEDMVLNFMNVKNNDTFTLAGALVFSFYPQMYFPQLAINALVHPGNDICETGSTQERFIDNKKITGSISEMLEESLDFIRKNMRVKTIIDENGKRADHYEYPVNALREAILNALVHRDYSSISRGKPIRLDMFRDRIEITSPGGLFGDYNIELLGEITPDTRNETLVNILEILKITENRYSGIPTIKNELKKYNLKPPEFKVQNGEFKTIFYNDIENNNTETRTNNKSNGVMKNIPSEKDILEFCKIPRSRSELKVFFGNRSNTFSKYILPLVKEKKLRYTMPEHPRSPNQKFVVV